eukprot:2372493-Amphidinium_carterae.4
MNSKYLEFPGQNPQQATLKTICHTTIGDRESAGLVAASNGGGFSCASSRKRCCKIKQGMRYSLLGQQAKEADVEEQTAEVEEQPEQK